jgi:L-cystine uptake protein TcyP (sodium:dicarboxylate symporter family)
LFKKPAFATVVEYVLSTGDWIQISINSFILLIATVCLVLLIISIVQLIIKRKALENKIILKRILKIVIILTICGIFVFLTDNYFEDFARFLFPELKDTFFKGHLDYKSISI